MTAAPPRVIPNRHAKAGTTGHVVARSIEPGESWRSSHADEQFV